MSQAVWSSVTPRLATAAGGTPASVSPRVLRRVSTPDTAPVQSDHPLEGPTHSDHVPFVVLPQLQFACGDPLGVMLLGHLDGLVCQETRHLFQGAASQQQLNRKGVAQHMAVEPHRLTLLVQEAEVLVVESADASQPCCPKALDSTCSRPEVVFDRRTVAGLQGCQRLQHHTR